MEFVLQPEFMSTTYNIIYPATFSFLSAYSLQTLYHLHLFTLVRFTPIFSFVLCYTYISLIRTHFVLDLSISYGLEVVPCWKIQLEIVTEKNLLVFDTLNALYSFRIWMLLSDIFPILLSSSCPLSLSFVRSFFLPIRTHYRVHIWKKNLARNYRISILFFNLMAQVLYICHRHFISGDKSWGFHLSFWVSTFNFLCIVILVGLFISSFFMKTITAQCAW